VKKKLWLALVLTALAAPAAASAWTSNSFQSPTHNIGCRYYPRTDVVKCMTRNDGFTLVLNETSRGRRGASYGVYVSPSAPVLPYGSSWRAFGFRCRSRISGMTCSNAYSGHGFFLERHTYRVW
jgi:hypothetical protein